MKKVSILVIFIFFVSIQPAWSYTTRLHKLSAGIKQVITGPFSVITVPLEHSKRENDQVLNLLGGVMEGATQAAVKPIHGVFKIVTFPFINHEYSPDE